MPDLVQTANVLKSLPDQALQLELANPSGAVPSYLVLAEAQRRATLRSGGAQQKDQQASSVYDDVLRNLTSGAPAAGPPAPPGAASPPSGPPPSGLGQVAPGSPPPPGNFKPPQAMAEGGSVDDESYDDGDDGEPLVPGAFTDHVLSQLAAEQQADVTVRVYLCRDRDETVRGALGPGSLVVMGCQKRWWQSRTLVLARQFRRGELCFQPESREVHGQLLDVLVAQAVEALAAPLDVAEQPG